MKDTMLALGDLFNVPPDAVIVVARLRVMSRWRAGERPAGNGRLHNRRRAGRSHRDRHDVRYGGTETHSRSHR